MFLFHSSDDLKNALDELKYSNRTLREIAKKYGIPRSTLSLSARESGIDSQHRNLSYDQEHVESAVQAIRGK